ncbi:hypothetical protein [Saccharopolyspora shandongensis]|uniref:hypothetical protein n=1 Tax=Saccharopolyspora shandongensis TaxID=418495 RepID=UPI0033F8C6B9
MVMIEAQESELLQGIPRNTPEEIRNARRYVIGHSVAEDAAELLAMLGLED